LLDAKKENDVKLSLDNIDDIDYIILVISRGGDKVKQWTIRMPEEVLEWLREKAAMETIRRKKQVSMNTLVVEILDRAMKADRKKGG